MNIARSTFAICSLVLLFGCYPDEDLSIDDLDLVVTQHDEGTNFNNFRTYSLPDTVLKIVDGEGRVDLEGQQDELILGLVRSNMESLGYVEEANPSTNPSDVVVLITAQEDDVFEDRIGNQFWFFWSWWSGWFGGWRFTDEWSGVSPFLPVSSKYNAGTIYIYMLDANSGENLRVPIVWRAVINGVIVGNTVDISRRIQENIDQAFDQSPYLSTN